MAISCSPEQSKRISDWLDEACRAESAKTDEQIAQEKEADARVSAGLARIIPDDPKDFALLLRALGPAEWPRLFEAVYDADKWNGKAVRESAERAWLRRFNKQVTGKDTDGYPGLEEITLSACASDPGELTKIDPEFLRSPAGIRFLQRLGKRVGKKQNEWGATEKIDAFMVSGWTHCLSSSFPPLAYFTDAAVASFFDLCVFGRERSDLDFLTVRQWRKRWGLVRPSKFLIRAVEPAGEHLRVVWIDH